MTYFTHKTASGTQPQAGYERLSVYRNPETGAIWVLWQADKTADEILAGIIGDLHIIGFGGSTDDTVLAVYPDLLIQKRSRIRAEGDKKLLQIAGEYSQIEAQTWTDQVKEADLYQVNGIAAECPMLNAFATGRGIPLAVLAQGVLDNAAAFRVASGQIMGAMYALLDQVNGATNLETALNIEWS